jgi:hypothetical protein
MKIKTTLILAIIATCLMGLILLSCESHEQKADDAYEQVKEEKFNSKSTITEPGTSQAPIKKKVTVTKVANPDEWVKFKQEIELKIQINEIKIKKFKSIPWVNSKTQRKVIDMEKENNDLRVQMKEFKEEAEDNWKKFKAKTILKVNDISTELMNVEISK